MVVNNLRVRLHCGTFSPVKWMLFQWIKENHISCHIIWEECRFSPEHNVPESLIAAWLRCKYFTVKCECSSFSCRYLLFKIEYLIWFYIRPTFIKNNIFQTTTCTSLFPLYTPLYFRRKYTLKTYKVIKDNIKIKPMVFNLCCL